MEDDEMVLAEDDPPLFIQDEEDLPFELRSCRREGVWKYEMRRECQQIVDSFYLGGNDAARSLPILHSLGITAIIIVRTEVEAPFLKARFPQTFHYAIFNVEDRAEQNLIRILPSFEASVKEVFVTGGKVLVHDDVGVSRANALVTMYLMARFAISFVQAEQFLQTQRYCTHLNAGFRNQCLEFESICKAQRHVGQDAMHTSSRKRSVEGSQKDGRDRPQTLPKIEP